MRHFRKATIMIAPDVWLAAAKLNVSRSLVSRDTIALACWAELRRRWRSIESRRALPFEYDKPPVRAEGWVLANPDVWTKIRQRERVRYDEGRARLDREERELRALASLANVPWDEVIGP